MYNSHFLKEFSELNLENDYRKCCQLAIPLAYNFSKQLKKRS